MKNPLFIFINILLAIIFFTQSSFAQKGNMQGNMPKDGKITGRVVEANSRKPIEYATISLHNRKDSSLVDGTISASGGYFELNQISMGNYYMLVSFIGFEKKKVNDIIINPKQKEIYLGNIEITESSLALDEFKVTADKRYIEYKVDKKVINVGQDIVSSGGTAVDVLENTPSVQVDIDGNVALRGSGSFTVLIDGKPSVLKGNDALKGIPASAIEKIEIITNPSAKYDPDGTGGIINIILKKSFSEGFNGIFNITGGMYNNFSTDGLFNYRTKKLNFFAGFNYSKRNMPGTYTTSRESWIDTNFYYTNATADRIRQHGGYSFKGGIDYELNKANYFTLSGELGSRAFGNTSDAWYHEYTKPFIYDLYYFRENGSGMDNHFYSGNLYYQHKFNQQYHELSMNAFYSFNLGNNEELLIQHSTDSLFNPLGIFSEQQKSLSELSKTEIRFKADYTKPFSKSSKLESGAQYKRNVGLSDYNFLNLDSVSSDWLVDQTRVNDVDFEDNVYAFYSTFSSKLFGFEYMTGIRAEYNYRNITQNILNREYIFDKLDFFPSVHISRQLPKEQQILASYSRKIERPGEWSLDPFPRYMDQYSIRIGNPGIEPEYINSYELSYQKRIKNTQLSAETYYRETLNKMERMITLTDSNIMVMTFDNLDRDYALGLELMGNFDIRKFITLSTSVNIFKYQLQGSLDQQDVVRENFTWDARINAAFRFKWGMRLQLTTSYEAPEITLQGREKGSLSSSLGIRQDFMKNKLSASLQVRDIFGHSRHSFVSEGSNFIASNEFLRKSPIISGTLTYNINNYKKRQDKSIEQIEMNGGGDGF